MLYFSEVWILEGRNGEFYPSHANVTMLLIKLANYENLSMFRFEP